jgi:hypothetical protein
MQEQERIEAQLAREKEKVNAEKAELEERYRRQR